MTTLSHIHVYTQVGVVYAGYPHARECGIVGLPRLVLLWIAVGFLVLLAARN